MNWEDKLLKLIDIYLIDELIDEIVVLLDF